MAEQSGTISSSTTSKPQGSIIKQCECQSGYQDERYGNKKRVCTKTSSGYRCTVCGKETKA
jgi:hypothetical protein